MRIVRDLRVLFSMARRFGVSVGRYVIAAALASLLMYVAEWLLVPSVLYLAQNGAAPLHAVQVLLIWIVALVGLTVFKRYIQTAFEEERDRFRSRANTELVRKASGLSYATVVTEAALLKRASAAVGRHIHAPIPAAWYTVSNVLSNGVGAVWFALVLLQINGWLALLALCTAICEALVHRFVTSRGERFAEKERELDGTLSYAVGVAQSSEFADDVRVLGMARWLRALHDRSAYAMEALLKRRGWTYFLYNAVDALMTLARNGVAYALLLVAVLEGRLSIAQFVLYFTAIGCFTECVSGLLMQGWTFRTQREELTAYQAYMELETKNAPAAATLPAVGIAHTLECRGVTFSYPGEDIPILRHLDLQIHSHQKTAIVAKDGRASSALAMLLCELYDPQEGQILLDGADLRGLERRAYYAMISSVLGRHVLPNITVGEWICGGAQEDEERVWECLSCVGLKSTVAAFPHGLQTALGRELSDEGVLLSGGQTQRLMWARALYKNADLWILDEPTTALDPLAQSELYETCCRRIGDRTAVFLSCRPTVSRFCDRVLFIADGRVSEEGTHDELMQRNGDYARLFSTQSRYYREGRDPDA